MTNKTYNEKLIAEAKLNANPFVWQLADALQAAQEEIERLKSELGAEENISREYLRQWNDAGNKLAAILEVRDRVRFSKDPADFVAGMREISDLLNTTNAQPAQEQGGKG